MPEEITGSRMAKEPDAETRVSEDDGEDTNSGDKLHLQLLLLEEDRQRSDLVWRQVNAFDDKLQASLAAFQPQALLAQVRALASLPHVNPILATSLHSLGRLRMVVQQQLRRASMRWDGSVYFAGPQHRSVAARCTQYLVWFFDFMDYLHELHAGFVDRIFLPLFRFFHEKSFLGSRSRASTSHSTFSKMSLFSADSSDDADNVLNEDEVSAPGGADFERVDSARRRAQSRTALKLLSDEFADIKQLYDTTEMDKVAQRLNFIKDQLDFMLEEEDEVDPDLFCEASGRVVWGLRMDEGTENLVRLPLDLLLKLRKAVWLARRWLTLYNTRTCDINTKLNKVLALEGSLTRRLQSLDADISGQERQLERQTEELHRLMGREERSEGLSLTLYDLDVTIAALRDQLQALRAQRDDITARVVRGAKQGALPGAAQAEEYRLVKLEFQRNKLQRYRLERRLATLDYQRQLWDQDRHLELHLRPDIIRHTNHVQDSCERLEETLRDQRRQRDNIRVALLPIREDRQALRDKVARLPPRKDPPSSPARSPATSRAKSSPRALRSGQAKFVRTYPISNSARLARPFPRLDGGGGGASGSRLALPRTPLNAPGWISPPQW